MKPLLLRREGVLIGSMHRPGHLDPHDPMKAFTWALGEGFTPFPRLYSDRGTLSRRHLAPVQGDRTSPYIMYGLKEWRYVYGMMVCRPGMRAVMRLTMLFAIVTWCQHSGEDWAHCRGVWCGVQSGFR